MKLSNSEIRSIFRGIAKEIRYNAECCSPSVMAPRIEEAANRLKELAAALDISKS